MSRIDDPLHERATALGQALSAARLRLVTVESCTGGMVAAAVTAVAGSSGWFEYGLVTYDNRAKSELAGVNAATLERHGAVSEQVAQEMALGGRGAAPGRVALAVTGIAGPDGGTPDKPVGTVCFAWAGPWGAKGRTHGFAGGRDSVRLQATLYALEQLWLLVREQAPRA